MFSYCLYFFLLSLFIPCGGHWLGQTVSLTAVRQLLCLWSAFISNVSSTLVYIYLFIDIIFIDLRFPTCCHVPLLYKNQANLT